MNRCVHCGGPLEFVGISQNYPRGAALYLRWDQCCLCLWFHASNGEGNLRLVTAEDPAERDKNIFVVLPDVPPEPVLKVKKVVRPKSAPGCGIGAYG